MSFQIEDSVEMPSHRNRFPFDAMKPGQSFEIVGSEESRKVRNAAYQYAKKVNTAKTLTKGQEGYVAFALRKTGELPDLDADGNQKTVTVTDEESGETKTVKSTIKIFRLWRE